MGVRRKEDVIACACPETVTVSVGARADTNEFICGFTSRIGSVDGQDWGWINTLYDFAKKTPRSELRPMYTV
jgi:hypothetical protein